MEWRVSRLIVVAVVVCFAFHLLYVLFVSPFKSYQGFFSALGVGQLVCTFSYLLPVVTNHCKGINRTLYVD